MKKAIAFATLATLATGCASATAGPGRWDDDDRAYRYQKPREAREYYDQARVVDVDPILRVVRVSTPHRECWNEPVTRYEPGGGNAAMGTIIGGVIGGVAGSRFGGGRGQDAAIIAGTLLGASVGHELSRRPGRSYTSYEQSCRVVHDYVDEQRVEGYRVTYRYRGATYTTRMPYDPGRTLRVQVVEYPAHREVSPAM